MDFKSSQLQITVLSLVVLAVLAGVVLWTGIFSQEESLKPDDQPDITAPTSSTVSQDVSNRSYVASTTIGQSVEGKAITAYTFTPSNGSSSTRATSSQTNHVLFVGGIHGGYEWNSVVLAYNLIDYLKENPSTLSGGPKVSVVPSANPDAVYDVAGKTGKITEADVPAGVEYGGPERFNANEVDLNRNFDCNWQPTSQWRGQEVSAGDAPFSEPEARAIRDFVQSRELSAGVFFHSAAGAVYGATCGEVVGPQTMNLLNTYAQSSGYRAVEKFDAYPVTGDVESWMTKLGIPAVSVELTNHQDVEWQKNRAGIKAVLNYFGSDR
jgi:predicted deacylase